MASPMAASELSCDIAIAGGGLGGLALAVGLKARGYDVHLFEAAPELRTATGTLTSTGGNGLLALDGLLPGLAAEVIERGCPTKTTTTYIRLSKDDAVKVMSAPVPMETVNIKWSTVQNMLASKLPEDMVHCSHRVTGYTEKEDYVLLHFKDKPDVRARLLVGADGLRSAIRATMVPQDPGPRWLGQMNWNAVVTNNDAADVWPAANELQVHANQLFFGGGFASVMCFVIDLGRGRTFWQARVAYDEPSYTTEPGSQEQGADGCPKEKNWGGMGKPGSKARVLEILEGHRLDRIQQLVSATPESLIFERGIYDRVPLDELGAKLTSPNGRVILLGDAAHAMHSSTGLGARMAYEDAHQLALLLDKHRVELSNWVSKGGDSTGFSELDLPALGKVACEYNAARLTRTCRVQRASAESAGLAELRERLKPAGLTEDERRQRAKDLYSWLYKYPMCPSGDPSSKFYPPDGEDEQASVEFKIGVGKE